jgi:large subunit ribosomal protein L4e
LPGYGRKAIRSAIAATADRKTVEKRGHAVSDVKELPLIVEDKMQEMKKTKEVVSMLVKLNLGKDLERSSKKTIKAGRTRGSKYKRKKSVLIIVKEDKGIIRASGGIAGVEAYLVKNLNVDALAPGGVPGRISVYSESAVIELKNLFK